MANGRWLPEQLIPYLLLASCLLTLAIPPAAKPPRTATALRPPGPPLLETFDAAPQLSLFPRLGDYRPEDEDERLPYWRTYRDHLLKTSGVIKADPASDNRVFSFRSIAGIDSVGHFAPLAVLPNTRYRISLELNTSLPEGASAGLGINEYRQFLWLGEQYPQSLDKEQFLASHELLRTRATTDWQHFEFSFSSGPQTRMIHLVLFREGSAGRTPVLIDNLSLRTE